MRLLHEGSDAPLSILIVNIQIKNALNASSMRGRQKIIRQRTIL
jgi:hypothetical protein